MYPNRLGFSDRLRRFAANQMREEARPGILVACPDSEHRRSSQISGGLVPATGLWLASALTRFLSSHPRGWEDSGASPARQLPSERRSRLARAAPIGLPRAAAGFDQCGIGCKSNQPIPIELPEQPGFVDPSKWPVRSQPNSSNGPQPSAAACIANPPSRNRPISFTNCSQRRGGTSPAGRSGLSRANQNARKVLQHVRHPEQVPQARQGLRWAVSTRTERELRDRPPRSR